MNRRLASAAALAAASVVVLAGCSSGSSASSASASPSLVGGMTECTKEALQSSVDEAAKALGADNQMPIDNVQCADGWAVVDGVLGPKDAPADGPQGAPTSMIFQAEGQFWIPKDKQAVCGTYDANSPDAVPADAQVPDALYPAGCLAG